MNTEDARLILDVLGSSGLREYVAAVQARVDDGRWSEALSILKDSGAPSAVAWEIVSGWPKAGAFGTEDGDRLIYKTRAHRAAVRLAHFVPSWRTQDWRALLRRGVRRIPKIDSGPEGARAEG